MRRTLLYVGVAAATMVSGGLAFATAGSTTASHTQQLTSQLRTVEARVSQMPQSALKQQLTVSLNKMEAVVNARQTNGAMNNSTDAGKACPVSSWAKRHGFDGPPCGKDHHGTNGGGGGGGGNGCPASSWAAKHGFDGPPCGKDHHVLPPTHHGKNFCGPKSHGGHGPDADITGLVYDIGVQISDELNEPIGNLVQQLACSVNELLGV